MACKWKIIEHSWRNTSIENEDGRIVCELDLESFDDLNENNQDKYEQLQRADAELIASAPALRDERDRLRAALQAFCDEVEMDAAVMAYKCDLGAGEWEAFIDRTKLYKQYLAGKAALTPAECTNHFTDGSKIFPSRNCCSKGSDGEEATK